jgi:uncharacterized membrane protein
MNKGRLEAFSDGVLAVIITIMVLEMKSPHGTSLAALRPLIPLVLSYVLSFVYLGIYWNNHHHLLHATQRVNGATLWDNLHLLFWLSLIPLQGADLEKRDCALLHFSHDRAFRYSQPLCQFVCVESPPHAP